MSELIKVDENGKITARELYDFLELNPTHFARWSKANIEDDSFYDEGVDYTTFATMARGNECKDYHLTIDFAKHLCMLSRSEKGKLARKYFVEVENRFKQQSFQVPQTFADALYLAAKQQEEIMKLESEKAILLPKAEFFDTVADSKTAVPMGEVSKVIAVKGMGRNNLFEFLRDKKVIDRKNIPYQQYQDRGYFRVIEQSYTDKQGEACISFKTLVYQKGIDFIIKLLKEHA